MSEAKSDESELSDLLCCPHCGSNEGFYRKVRYNGSGIYRWPFSDTTPQPDNSDMYDRVNSRDSRRAWCVDCDKEIKELKAT